MASLAIRHYSDDYDDIVVSPPCHLDDSGLSAHGEYVVKMVPWSAGYSENQTVVAIPLLYPSAHRAKVSSGAGSLVDSHSIRLVFENIKGAPIAYFRFMSAIGFLLFAFSVLFYLIFGTILFNPLLAVFGALGALLTVLLVEASLLIENKNSSKKRQREFRA